MKTYLVALVSLGLFINCAKEEVPTTGQGNLNQDVKIALNETLELAITNKPKAANRNRVRVHLAELKDSRCPMNVNCIRYGSAVARFWLEKDQERSSLTELVIGEALPTDSRKLRNRTADTTLVTVANSQYEVILKNVTPYPCAGCPNQETPEATMVLSTK